jgi:anti-sigma factor RsiW
MGSPRCQWVRDRLPLVVGDDLRGPDRRRVERHLIGCPQCRQHQTALGQALETLRAAAALTPAQVQPDAPSLWPALARQIRESRRPVPTSPFAFGFAFSWLRVNLRPALGLGLGLGLLVTLGVNLGVRNQIATAQARIRANEVPIVSVSTFPRSPLTQTPAINPKLRPELPAPVEAPVVENTPSRLYDLDHGRPPETREARDTKATY